MLQNTALSITEAVTKLFNISISLGKLADEWKIPRITHIDPENMETTQTHPTFA